MDSHILAYLAGIVDGEGSINITQYKTVNGYIRWRPSIKIAMVDSLPIKLYSETFGFKVYEGKAKSGRMVYSCEAAWHGCQRILETLLPYLRSKKELAIVVIDFCKHVSSYRAKPPPFIRKANGQIISGGEFNTASIEEAQYRLGVYQKVKSLIYGKSNTIHRKRLSEEAVKQVTALWMRQSELKGNESSEISRND